ncbi:hypothetical protein LZ31DRAFT_242001 [Colletotrichum somersetense]|nr:hypothetical protein LZ31DRAFT_242001 [Colletotrichum somersetense]
MAGCAAPRPTRGCLPPSSPGIPPSSPRLVFVSLVTLALENHPACERSRLTSATRGSAMMSDTWLCYGQRPGQQRLDRFRLHVSDPHSIVIGVCPRLHLMTGERGRLTRRPALVRGNLRNRRPRRGCSQRGCRGTAPAHRHGSLE